MRYVPITVLLLLLALGIRGCAIEAVEEDARRASERRDWMQFSAAHRCHIKPTGFWSQTVWACDGFDIEHND